MHWHRDSPVSITVSAVDFARSIQGVVGMFFAVSARSTAKRDFLALFLHVVDKYLSTLLRTAAIGAPKWVKAKLESKFSTEAIYKREDLYVVLGTWYVWFTRAREMSGQNMDQCHTTTSKVVTYIPVPELSVVRS